MKYALGNMLNGAGGLNADQLALDLQFAADKTLTARKGPTPVFTRASSGTFVGSNGLIQSAGNNVARFDHDPVTLASKGLLIEESRTNLLQRSEEFGNSYWTTTRAAITTDATTSPDGLTTAEKLIADTTAASNHRVDRPTVTLALNTVHTVSIFAKASEYTGLALGVGLAATEGVRFSLVGAGTATPVAAGNTGTIQQLPNGWYRCTCTFTSDATTATHRVAIYVGQNGTTFSYTGNNTSGIFIWGAQLEVGSFATSYIPTTTASVVRSADVCSISGAGFTGMWNALEGSLFTSAIFNAPVAYGTIQLLIDINDTTAANRLRYLRNSSTGTARLASTSGNNLNVVISGVSALQSFVNQKYSAGFKLDDYVLYVSNSQIGTDNIGSMIVSPTTMTIGDASAGTTRQYLNGTISAIRYYRKRLDNAKLQALTA